MENKIERLRQSIKSNPNLTEEFKCNLGTLTDTLVTVFPQYDYSNFERVLSGLSVTNNEQIESYTSYNDKDNILSLNTSRIFDDRIDLQHLFLNELLSIGTGVKTMDSALEGFNIGLTEAISSTMNNDESMKKLNVLEYIAMSIFSKIVDSQVLIDSYMNKDIGNVGILLESFGVQKDEFLSLINLFNEMRNKHTSDAFAESEVVMTNMFSKVVDAKLKNGTMSYEDIGDEYDDFSSLLIFGKSELISLYPHHDFSYLTGFEKVKSNLEKNVVSSEIIDTDVLSK